MIFVLFVDIIFYVSMITIFLMVNMELSKLSKWFSVNKLSLNVRKTSYMLFDKKNMSMMIYKFVLIRKN